MEKREWKMGKILKILSLVLVSLALVFGTGIHADAKKKKKKINQIIFNMVLMHMYNRVFQKKYHLLNHQNNLTQIIVIIIKN